MRKRTFDRRLKRLARRRSRKARRASGPAAGVPSGGAARRRAIVEPLEPRLLLSADIVPAAGQAIDDGLSTLNDWVDQIQQIGDLADDLPLIGDSLGDLVDLGDQLRSGLLDTLRNALPTNLADPSELSDDVAAAMNAIPGATVVDESTPDEIRFDVDFDAARDLVLPLRLGDAAVAAGIDLDAELDLLASISLDFDFGMDLDPGLSPEEAFFLDIDEFRASIAIDGFVDGGVETPTLDTGFDLGFVEAKIVGGSLEFVAALDLDPDTSGDGVVSLEELLSSGLSPDALASAASTSFSASLPVVVDVDPSFAFPLAEGVTLQFGGIDASNLFDLPDFDIDVDVPDPLSIGFDPSDFTNVSPGEIVGLLAGLGNQLQVLTEALEPAGGIPFVSDAVASVVNYASMIQNILDPLFDAGINAISKAVADLSGAAVQFDVVIDGVTTTIDNIAAIDHGSVPDLATAITDALDAKGVKLEAVVEDGQLQLRALGNDVLDFTLEAVSADAQSLLGFESEMLARPLFNFSTIQDFEDVLNSIAGLLGTAIDAVYDATSNTIGFTLDFSESFSETLRIGFTESIDLGIADLDLLASGAVTAAGTASLVLDLAVDLQGLLPDTPLDQLNGGRGVRTSGAGDADLNIAIRVDGADPMDPPVAAFDVDLSGAVTLGDIVSAITTAATTAGQTLDVSIDPSVGLKIDGPDGFVVEVALASGSFAAFDLGFGLVTSALDEISGATLLERIYVKDTTGLSASLTLSTPDPINGVASVGFLEAQLMAMLTAPVEFSVELGLQDPNSDGRISLLELGDRDDTTGVLASVGSFDLDLTGGELQIDLKLAGAEEFGVDQVPVTTLTASFMDLGDTVDVDFDIDSADLESILEQFQNLSFGDIVALVGQIAETLSENLGFLGDNLPFLGSSLSDLLSLVNDSTLGDLQDLRNLLNPTLNDAAETAGGMLDVPLFLSFVQNGLDIEGVVSEVELQALEALRQLQDIDPARFAGVVDDMLQAFDALDEAIRALPSTFDITENATQLFTAFQALLVVVDRVRGVEDSDLDLLTETAGDGFEFTQAQLESGFNSFRSDLLEAVFGVAGDPARPGLRNLIPSGDAIIERVIEALGLTVPTPSSALMDSLQDLVDDGIGFLNGARTALNDAAGSLPGGLPASVGTAIGDAVDAIDSVVGTGLDADGLLEKVQELLTEVESFVDSDLRINTADLVRGFQLVSDAVAAVGSAISEVRAALQAIEDMDPGDVTAAIEDLRDDVLIPQRDALVDDALAAVDGALKDILREFGGSVVSFSFDDGALIANLHYDADIIGEIFGIPDMFDFDFALGGADVPIGFDAMIEGTLALTGAFDLGFGVDASGGGGPDFFLVAGSGIELMAELEISSNVGVSFFGFEVGSLGTGADPMTLTLTNEDMDAPAELSVTIDDTGAADGRVILGTDSIDLTPTFDAKVAAHVPIYILGTQVEVDDGMGGTFDLEIDFDQNLTDLSSFVPQLDLPNPADAAQAILDAILAAGLNLEQILDAVEAFMRVLEQGLGNDAVKDLPIVGDAAGGAAGGIETFRTGFFEPARAQLEGVIDGLTDAATIEAAIEDLFRDLLESIDADPGTPVDPDESTTTDPLTIEIGLGSLVLDIELIDSMTGTQAGLDANALTDPDVELRFGLSWDFNEEREFFFDLGLEALDFASLETSGSVILALQAMVGATIGLNREGVFLEFDDQDGGEAGLQPIAASASVSLSPGSSIAARLFFLELEATAYDEAADTARLGADASAKVQEGVQLSGDLVVTVPDMTYTVSTLDDLSFDPVLSAELDIDLLLDLSVGNPDLPSANVVIDIDWDVFRTDGGGGDPVVNFFNLRLDIGNFLGGALGQVIDGLDKFIEPIRPILAILGTEIPVISDLAKLLGQDPITFGTAIEILGSGADSIEPLITVLETIDTITGFIDMIDTSGGFVIDFGDLDLSSIGGALTDASNMGSIGGTALSSGTFALPDLSGVTSGASGDPGTDALFSETSATAGFSGGALIFPIFDDPSKLFSLLFGKREDLITWKIPRLAAEFGFQYTFGPILPPVPLFATIAGSLEIFAELAMGFDLRGFESGQNFFDGFHFEDLANPVDHDGEDILELGLIARFSASAQLSVLVAQAGVVGGIEASIGANWHDNDGDGRIYLDELAFNFNRGIECVFDFEGALEAFFSAFVKLGFDTPFGFVTLFEATLDLVRVTLLDFQITCPPLPPPVPADQIGQDVYLNIGDRAEFRQPGAEDVDEEIFVIAERDFLDENGDPLPVVSLTDLNGNGEFEEAEILAANDYDGDGVVESDTILVFGFGQTSIFENAGNIIGNAGAGDDTIIFDPSVMAAGILTGGAGDDEIQGGSGMDDISGGDGDDQLKGGAAMDMISGGAGDDLIVGEEGDDKLFGDDGVDKIFGNQGNNETPDFDADPDFTDDDIISGGAGQDDLRGDWGDDLMAGGSGADAMQGGFGADEMYGDGTIDKGSLAVTASPAAGESDLMEGGEDSDELHGGGGNDILFGEGARVATNNGGDDVIFGDAGNDTIRDGFLSDEGEEGHEEGDDEFHGGAGNDQLVTQSGMDMAFGGSGDDEILSGTEADYVEGGGGRDRIRSGSGDDRVIGGSSPVGAAVIDLGAELLFDEATHADFNHMDGGSFFDTGDDIETGAGNDIVIGDNGAFYDGASLTTDPGDTVTLITTFSAGGGGADRILAGSEDDRVFAGGGADLVFADDFGGSGHDIVVGDQGYMTAALIIGASSAAVFPSDDDTIQGQGGNDILIGGDGGDVLGGSAGRDLLVGDNAEVDILGAAGGPVPVVPVVLEVRSRDTDSGGDDRLLGNQGSDIGLGGFGNDFLSGGGTGDVPTGGDPSPDILLGDHGVVQVDPASDEHDIFSIDDTPANNGMDRIVGSGRHDILVGGGNDDSIEGLTGNDVILGDHGYVDRDGADTILTIRTIFPASGGADEATGGSGDDVILGGADGDILHGNTGDDTLLGDNGLLDWIDPVLDPGQDKSTLDLITTTSPNDGGEDMIFGDEDDDVAFGGTDSDEIYGGSGDDLLFGDHGKRHVQEAANMNFFAIDTQGGDGGNDDMIFGEAGNDILLGQQGDDEMFGGSEDDDLIGGHNVAGGIDEIDAIDDGRNDVMDGGSGFDLLAGDNAIVVRQALPDGTLTGSFSPRFRETNDGVMYADDGSADVDATSQEDPKAPRPVGRDVTLLDHDDATALLAGVRPFGSDHMTGGADDDSLFGQLDGDLMLGDGSVDPGTLSLLGPEAASDGDDYIEGNGGNDMIWGGLGQDDILGGSSDLFGLSDPTDRPDGADIIFGGAGIRIGRNEFVSALDPLISSDDVHSRDSDVILGDNGRIFRLVDASGLDPVMLEFEYDESTTPIVPRAVDLLDYDPADVAASRGAGDLIRGESGDDFIHGMTGDDTLFGDSENDDMFGENGSDWISGGTGEDAVLGDDGKIQTSRGGVAEPLYDIDATSEEFISTPANALQATLDPTGELKRTVDLEPFDVGYDDIVYGGLGDDALHGGAGNDGISGAEALPALFAAPLPGSIIEVDADGRIVPRSNGVIVDEWYSFTNALPKLQGHALNFVAVDVGADPVKGDGEDVLFGDLGLDWLVGGSGRDRMYGGLGNDILNADDDLETNGGLNDVSDTGVLVPSETADIAYGGGGRDILIGNTGADRLVDWTGEFNEFQLPFAPFGVPTVIRDLAPWLSDFLYDVSESDGADPTRVGQGLGSANRNGEPYGELGLVRPQDPEWSEQHGGPAGGQAGNSPGQQRDSKGDNFGGGGANAEQFDPEAAPEIPAVDTVPSETPVLDVASLDAPALRIDGVERIEAAPFDVRVAAPVAPALPEPILIVDSPDAVDGRAGFVFDTRAGSSSGVVSDGLFHEAPRPAAASAEIEVLHFDPRSAQLQQFAPAADAPIARIDANDDASALLTVEAAGDAQLSEASVGGETVGLLEVALGSLGLLAALGADAQRRQLGERSWAAPTVDWGRRSE